MYCLSVIRFYDESVVAYFKDNIKVDTGEGVDSPQVTFALPSRQGVKLEVSESKTPLLPLLAVVRTGLSPNPETKIVKSKVNRPMLYSISSDKRVYEGAEMMPYNINYQLDYFTLTQEMYNEISEKLLFCLFKRHSVKTFVEISNHNLEVNGYIHDVSLTDSTPYVELPDTSTRIFHGTATFSLYTMLLDPNYYTRSVLDISLEKRIVSSETPLA